MSKQKKTVTAVLLCLLAFICLFGFVMARQARAKQAEAPVAVAEGVEKRTYKDQDYYIYLKDYSGEYDIQCRSVSSGSMAHKKELADIDVCAQMDYDQYRDYCEKHGLKQKYTGPDSLYLVCGVSDYFLRAEAKLAAVEYCGDTAELYILGRFEGVTGTVAAYVCVVPTDVAVKNVRKINLYTDAEYENITKYGTTYDPSDPPAAEKPVIYLYPELETDVTVTLGYPERVTHSYPKYDGPWRVRALPDGTLTDLETGRELYSLYYENVSAVPLPQTGEGFVVRGEDTAAFLEEKLAVLGLTDREAEEFIVYWLPRMEDNAWNYIRFASDAELAAEMPLRIEPQPDSVIRVLMLWKPLDAPIEVTEQELETPQRTGFTAVEWGGAEIN